MAVVNVANYIHLFPMVSQAPGGAFWTSYDEGADVMYVNFRKPSIATDSELTDDDVIFRYEGEELIGLTILHASKRD
jgi:uncharacterized protein YuzE